MTFTSQGDRHPLDLIKLLGDAESGYFLVVILMNEDQRKLERLLRVGPRDRPSRTSLSENKRRVTKKPHAARNWKNTYELSCDNLDISRALRDYARIWQAAVWPLTFVATAGTGSSLRAQLLLLQMMDHFAEVKTALGPYCLLEKESGKGGMGRSVDRAADAGSRALRWPWSRPRKATWAWAAESAFA